MSSRIRTLFDRFGSSSDSEETKKQLFAILFKDENIDMITDLSIDDIKRLIKIELLSDLLKKKLDYDSLLGKISKLYKIKVISKNRLGRLEGVEISKTAEEKEGNKDNPLINKMLGIR